MKNAAQQDLTLRTPEDQLQQSRKQYVNSLINEQQFEADCLIIIPDLERLWKERVLVFGFPADTLMDWKPYLRYFKPQTLAAGIDLLVKRLNRHEQRYGSVLPQPQFQPTPEEINATDDMDGMKERINRAGGVQNVRAYYRQLVQDLRHEEMKSNPIRKHFNETIMKCVLDQASGMDISFNIPQQTYDEAGVHLPTEHRKFAEKMGWIDADFKLTNKGEAVLLGLQGGFAIAFLIAVN
jgi:hypothetical protein